MNTKNLEHTQALLHERDAAQILGVSIAWMQKSRYMGSGPRHVKVGGKTGRAVRYRPCDLAEYITENLVETTDTQPKRG